MENIMHKIKIVDNKKQPKSLKKIITNSKLRPNTNSAAVENFNGSICRICAKLLEGSE